MKRLRYLSMEYYFSQVAIRRIDANGQVKIHIYNVDVNDKYKAAIRLGRIALIFRLDIIRRFAHAMFLASEAKQLEEPEPKKRHRLFGRN